MIYALNESTGVLVGKFDTLAMAEVYVEKIPDHENFVYTYLEDINSMNYTTNVGKPAGRYMFGGICIVVVVL